MRKLGFLFLLFGVSVLGQDHLSGFEMMSLTYRFHPKWILYGEVQARSRRDYSVFDYYETKGGIGYDWVRNNQIFVGAGKYGTYENSRIAQEEFRLWLQYTFSQKLGKLKLDHRGRAEKRFFYADDTRQQTEAMRYRYRLTATLPINKKEIVEKTFFANAFEELFFGPEEPNFKRNRAFAGFGYQYNNSVSATTGYLFQRDFSVKKNENYHYLYFSVNFTIDQSKHKREIDVPMPD